MGSSQLKIDKTRSTLYYGKYEYRATFWLYNARIANRYADINDYVKLQKEHDKLSKTHGIITVGSVINQHKVDYNAIQQYVYWRDANKKNIKTRIEGNHVGIFSNDLALLKTLEKIYKDIKVSYSRVDPNVHVGVLYFDRPPKFKYRVYLKSKQVSSTFSTDILEFYNRYKGTDTEVNLSPGLYRWITSSNRLHRYMYTSYFIDYNEESTLMLIMLLFDGMIRKQYKLEKRPR